MDFTETGMDSRDQVWKWAWKLEAPGLKNGTGKLHILVWNWVKVWRTSSLASIDEAISRIYPFFQVLAKSLYP